MHPRLVQRCIAPAIERLLGRQTFANLAELEDSQWWSPRHLRKLQERKLRALLQASSVHCPYYGRLFAERGINVQHDAPFEALSKLPVLDKAAIRRNLPDMTNRRIPGGPIRFNTGGSTGEPLVFHVDRRRIGYDKAARMLTHRWFGVEPGEREVYLWGSPIELKAQDHLKRLRDWLINERLLDAFNLTPPSMDRYLAEIAAFNPVSVFGYPTSLATLAEHGEATGEEPSWPHLQAVFVTGELLAPHHRRILRRFFRAPVANGYGSRDGGFIAHECPDGGMHILEQNVFVEILDPHGQPVPCGEAGEIVITHLDAYATPLLRYRTGDVGRFEHHACRCGRSLRTLGMVAGRLTDHLVAADGALRHALSVIYIIRDLPTVRQFQIRQAADRNLRVSIVPEHGFTADDADHIRRDLHRRMGRDLDIRIELVDAISVEKSGKFRHVVSDAVAGGPHQLAEPCQAGVP